MIYEYKDSYLTIDQDREDRAIVDVEIHGLVDTYYIEKLTVYKAYIIACIEDVRSTDDTFSAKLKYYRTEFDKTLSEAKAYKASATTGVSSSSWSVEIGRG